MAKYKLYGFCSPSQTSHTFLTPLFKKDDRYYTQVIDDKYIVFKFEEVVRSEIRIFEAGDYPEIGCGDYALFGFSDQDHEIYSGTQNDLKHYLRSKVKDYIDKPFFYKDVSGFCEKILPEFYGCESSKDYLIRQVISNLIPDFVERLNVRLEKEDGKRKTLSEIYKWQALLNKNESIFRLASEQDSLKDTYLEFVSFATEKHKNLIKYKSISESLEMADVVFTHFSESNLFDYTHIRNNLIYILDKKIIGNKEDISHYKPKLSKQVRKEYAQHADNLSAINSSKVTTGGLSLIIYITSRFTQEAKKRNVRDGHEGSSKRMVRRLAETNRMHTIEAKKK